uniref:Proline-rich protein PRCC n=1 Tax=Anthurium amnicola TaxID=1678845 RepID=A0A1D1ZKY1_9ARAE
MESLVANYASSDEEGGGGREDHSKPFSTSLPPPRSASSSSSLFSSLPLPKSTSSSSPLFTSLPPPKSSSSSPIPTPKSAAPSSSSPSSSLFSSLPPPKSRQTKPPPTAERVVQFRPPVNPSLFKPDEEDDEDAHESRRRTQDFSSKPLSSIIPPPKHTLGLGSGASSASARRSIVEADVPVRSTESTRPEGVSGGGGGAFGDRGTYVGRSLGGYPETGVDGQPGSDPLDGGVASSWAPGDGSYDAYGTYGSYENCGSYGGDWDYGLSEAGTVSAAGVPELARSAGKRGRDEIPSEILEVKQDELIKNRPREDQARLTGIAFGPSYQPASSGKGKPSKLHRRKHQIGSLYHDMKQKEMELAERRAKGFLTKKETQAKYGW